MTTMIMRTVWRFYKRDCHMTYACFWVNTNYCPHNDISRRFLFYIICKTRIDIQNYDKYSSLCHLRFWCRRSCSYEWSDLSKSEWASCIKFQLTFNSSMLYPSWIIFVLNLKLYISWCCTLLLNYFCEMNITFAPTIIWRDWFVPYCSCVMNYDQKTNFSWSTGDLIFLRSRYVMQYICRNASKIANIFKSASHELELETRLHAIEDEWTEQVSN